MNLIEQYQYFYSKSKIFSVATTNVAIKDNEVANLKTFTLEEM